MENSGTFANTIESLKQKLADFPLVHRTTSNNNEHIGYIVSCSSFFCCQDHPSANGLKYTLSTNDLPNNFVYFYQTKPIIVKRKIETRREKIRSDDSETSSITSPYPADTWLIGGSLGAKNSLLLFRSSALANVTPESIHSKPGYKLHITYKVTQTETKLLAKLLHCHGISEAAPEANDFNILWVGNHPKPGVFRSLASHQRINHFPRSYELTRKDRLYKNIERMQHSKGMRNFDFIPQSFIMPGDFKELCSVHYRMRGPWIVKPAASSRGRGIFIVETPYQVPLDEPVIVAKYICNPLLIDGHKCDLRLYVAVTSYDPLLIYIYEEGLVRFATVKYDNNRKQLWNPCMHLCNYSINKYHSDYIKSDDPCAENVGHKWTLSALLRHLKSNGKDTILLMEQIEDIIVKAIITSANSIVAACQMFVPNQQNCFELFGFDILIDEDLKPWLLEVNLSPSLGCDSPLDVRLKSAMLADLLTLIGVPAVDPMIKAPGHHHSTLTQKTSNMIKMKLGTCRRVHSADGLSQGLPQKGPVCKSSHVSSLALTADENRIIKLAKMQFERRGGWVRIFPTADSWQKYAQYLNPNSGIPTSALPNSSSTHIVFAHNYNLLLHQHLFPKTPVKQRQHLPSQQGKQTKHSQHQHQQQQQEKHQHQSQHSQHEHKHQHQHQHHQQNQNQNQKQQEQSQKESIKTTAKSSERHHRYERKLDVGHRTISLENKKVKNVYSESKSQVCSLIKSGKLLTEKELEEVLASQTLRTVPHCVSSPIHSWGFQGIIKALPKGVHRQHKKKTAHKISKHS